MKRKSILALTLVTILSTSAFISGCGKSSTTNSGSNNTSSAQEKTTDEAKNQANAVGDNNQSANNESSKAGDIKYTAADFKNDITKAGYDIKDSLNNTKNYFTGKETNYSLGKDTVRVYEYDSADKLNADIKTISPDGITINGENVGFTNKPYYYSKGNSLIVYEGNNPTYVDQFSRSYGSTIIP